MGKEKIIFSEFYAKLFASYRHHLDLSPSCDEEVLHRLRVDIKYMRNAWKLAVTATGEHLWSAVCSEQVLPVFRQSGAVRNLDVTLQLARQGLPAAGKIFINHLVKLRTAERKKYKALVAGYNHSRDQALHRRLTERLAAITEQEVQEAAHTLMSGRARKAAILLSHTKTHEELHEVRKQLKVIKTSCRLMLEIHPDAGIRRELKRVRQAEEKIGNWHDRQVWSERLDLFLDTQGTFRGRSTLVKFSASLRQEVESEMQRIARQLQKQYPTE